MGRSKYEKKLAPLQSVPFFTTEQALEHEVPRQALAYLVETGVLKRVHSGTYSFVVYEPQISLKWEHMGVIAATIPNGVICLLSALSYYHLTDEVMREVWIAVPHACYTPRRPNTRIVRMRNVELGRMQIDLGEYKVDIFDRERCVLDAFRYLNKEITLEVFHRYFKSLSYKPDPEKIIYYARQMQVNIEPNIKFYKRFGLI
jgi:predicted transcriptional regulator of viral defense system